MGFFSTSHPSGYQVDGSPLAFTTEAFAASCSPGRPAPIDKIEVENLKIFGRYNITLAVRSNQVLGYIVMLYFD